MFMTDYRVRLARAERHLTEAERLQGMIVDYARPLAQPALEAEHEIRTYEQRYAIYSLAVALTALADIQLERSDAACADAYKEALALAEASGDAFGPQAICHNLGNAYTVINNLRDLDQAEHWQRRSLKLTARNDTLGCGRS